MTADYGPWSVVAGGSDGVGVAFGHQMATRGTDAGSPLGALSRRAAVLALSNRVPGAGR